MPKRRRRPESPPRAQASGVHREPPWIAPAIIAAAFALMAAVPTPVPTQSPHRTTQKNSPKVEVAPGTLVRWAAPGTKRCAMAGRSWKAMDDACYYPIDLLHKPGTVVITRSNGKKQESARIVVGESPYGTEDVTLPDIPQAHPTPEDEERNAREQERVAAIWKRKPGPAKFSLPLGNPAKELPEAKTFGWNAGAPAPRSRSTRQVALRC